ncbi:enoyl-CoA hydratase/isomerase family protein [Amycolatopsis alkalitolerans]|uniref:enoyl-CoA hydratase n=1 Tax=Amycolatopsis alkalitolerans TaxID=2547244 RepID=A0A5C4M929_9PSEU|nr:enoyl-CoA hydratase-related protein [Amycolatopsis alkalitolerans]TNC29464.1 enoyl-CoA hydratase/isomerase family protein [Amycolatopsis alkalitolerans]
MSEGFIAVERDGAIATVRIDRPTVHNALNSAILQRLGDQIAELAASGTTRAIVLTGTGEKAFSAGADLDELANLDAEDAAPLMRAGQSIIRGIERSPVPVIAAVNGLALGGGFELVLACSFAVVSTTAAFGLPEAGLGLIPGYGGTQRLARVAGPAVARHVMLTGHRIDANRAYRLGIAVAPPVEPGELMPFALDVAREVATRGPAACRAILDAVDAGLDSPLDVGLALETRLAAMAIGGSESTEGVAAFKQKRRPEFGVRA